MKVLVVITLLLYVVIVNSVLIQDDLVRANQTYEKVYNIITSVIIIIVTS